MANVIKHKRGSGSDPAASDLVVGEVAIRTDVGKLFTKMDNGSVAEIAGGGSDIAINTLSSSSATGGGSATFNGSAYRFTLSSPPSVSAQQLLVSINGVVQKPVAGTGQPSEGFSVSGNDIILGDAPATGSDFFILTFKSLGVSEPADNSVTSAKIVDGAIVNADINASAAIDGSKISPSFGSQAIVTTGSATIGTDLIHAGDTDTKLSFGTDTFLFNTAGTTRLSLTNSSATFPVVINAYETGNNKGIRIHSNGGISATDNILRFNTGQTNGFSFCTNSDGTSSNERLRIDSSGRLLIGTTTEGRSTADHLTIASAGHTGMTIRSGTSHGGNISFSDGTSGDDENRGLISYDHADNFLRFFTNAAERLRIDSSGNVGIGTTSPSSLLHLADATEPAIRIQDTNNVNSDFKIYSPDGANHLRINHINTSSDFVTLTSAGDVGIGTTSPTGKLHINSGTTNTCATFESTDAGAVVNITDNSARSSIEQNGTDLKIISDTDASDADSTIKFQVDASTKMIVDSSGRVGIGTTTGAVGGAPSSQTGQFNVITSAGSGQWAMQARADNVAGNGLFLRAGNNSSYYTAYLTGYDENNVHMVVRGDGKVGIGTASPVNPLHVVLNSQDIATFESTSASNSGAQVSFKHTSASPADNDTIANLTFDGRDDGNNATTYAQLRVLATDVSNNSESGAYQFFTRNAGSFDERMRIDSSGNVGIGTTSPDQNLSVVASNSATPRIGITNPDNAENFNISTYHDSNGIYVGIGANAKYNANGNKAVDTTAHKAALLGLDARNNGAITFYTGGTGGTLYERWRVTEVGQHYFNTTSSLGSGVLNIDIGGVSSAAILDLGIRIQSHEDGNHALHFQNTSGSNVGEVIINASSTSYSTSSDYRLKENVVAISDGITRLKTLKPYRFNFKADPSTTVDGFFAHEVTAVPEAINGTKDEIDSNGDPVYQGIDQSKLVPLLVAALQEAIGRIEALEAK